MKIQQRRKTNGALTDQVGSQALANIECITSPGYSDVPRMVVKRGKVYTVVQSYAGAAVYSTTGGYNAGSLYFQLSNLQNQAAYIACFDQYRVAQLEFVFLPQYNTNNSGTSSPGQLVTVIDYDDSNLLTSWAAALSYDSAVITQATASQRRTLTPKLALATYTGTFTGYALGNPWSDTSSSSTRYYGVKWYLENSLANSDQIYSVQVRVVLQLRNAD
jgi:hypothetical protein